MKTQPKPKGKIRRSSESGYTILEGLMAIVVVSVLMAAVSPMIVLATATRMQAKRIQLASQAANSYVAYMRSDSIDPVDDDQDPDTSNAVNKAPGNVVDLNDGTQNLQNFPAPTSGLTLGTPVSAQPGYFDNNTLYCVDFDSSGGCETDSQVDMVVQPIMRPFPQPDPNDANASIPRSADFGYDLAVRVYRANAFVEDQLETGEEDADGNGGVDSSTTALIGQRSSPLINLQTSLEPTGDTAFDTYCTTLNCGN